MKDKLCQIGEYHLKYNPKKWKNMGVFDILNDISENVTLVKLMNTLGNLNRAINIVGYWIFDSNYKKPLHLKMDSLDLIRSPSVGEEQVVKSKQSFTLLDACGHQ